MSYLSDSYDNALKDIASLRTQLSQEKERVAELETSLQRIAMVLNTYDYYIAQEIIEAVLKKKE